MGQLHSMFLKQVQLTENIDASGYRVFRLKRRLQRDFPQLVFHGPQMRNVSEFVFVEEVCVADIVDNSEYVPAGSEYEEDSDGNVTDDSMEIEFEQGKEASISEFYHVAIALRKAMEEVQNIDLPWPPTSADLSNEDILRFIPIKLFNFFSWCLRFSDEPELETHVQLNKSQTRKVFSICQDMLYIFSSGKLQTPKSLALGMAVRQLTRSSQLTHILNGFGHCAGLGAILTYETELAKQSMTSEMIVPKDIDKNRFACLVYDNNHFSEESMNQTHVLGGIWIQKEKQVGVHPSQQSVQPRKKGGRSLPAPSPDMMLYNLGKKITPSFADIDFTKAEEPHLECQELPRTLDFVYVLMKFYQSQSVVPGWTGFNILLKGQNIPPVSKIRYLPIIDGSPSDYSTLYIALQQSLKIADELSLEKIVLVFDEAIYAKMQQIRWKDEVLMNRFVVRLREFHATMSFLSTIGACFRDAGLQVIMCIRNIFYAIYDICLQ